LERIDYWIIEPAVSLRRKQEAFLRSFRPRVSWFNRWADVPRSGIQGIIFSNELLDSFPFYRAVWDAARKTWFEWRITWSRDRFVWERTPVESEELKTELQRGFWRSIHPGLLDLLPDGFSVEVCPAARAWWSEASNRLCAGKLLTFDYGLETHEFLAPQRSAGTFRSYREHLLGQDPLANPGEQDLTAHVNFTTLEETGKASGLHTDYFGTQSAFLTKITEGVWKDLKRFGPWTGAQNRQFQTLTHPDHFGRSFRVLVQSRTRA
jgi:SAM-dependent MidA family methyltransferase